LDLETINGRKKGGFIFHPSFYVGFGIRDEKFSDPDLVSGIKHSVSATLLTTKKE
jgi:hypothetical protein